MNKNFLLLSVAALAFNVNASLATNQDQKLTIKYEDFELSLNCKERASDFFFYEVKHDSADYKTDNHYSLDTDIPLQCQQFSTKQYRIPYLINSDNGKKVEYVQGQLVPENHLDYSPTAIRMAARMTNVVPMTKTVATRGGAWFETNDYIECLRERIQDPESLPLGKQSKTFKVMGGVIWGTNNDDNYFINSHGVKTPDYLWKVLYDQHAEFSKVPSYIAWLIPNTSRAIKENLPKYRVSIRELEEKAGIILPIRSEMKVVDDYPLWETPELCDKN
ncbi:DNA/RNA non-specific endonuclease [Pseudoalteromonas sp. OFAV1]|jgi:endonuclease G|uniref:DNA/RNA non-specific endonuclease n=1 Tax=Pseudoalteromonas sp. OFAV1 TaxID=2908892 RepID=UPI001F2BC0AD|nr:DNA/RNA non-specific endonuclease [Pseudoalteromonas sp. OFAV1]MCF2902251.1 DNA/RNA non-specific endonuclease [Pseudoalteromonas sp. OFAV1]